MPATDRLARQLDRLARLGAGEEAADFAAHRELMRPDFCDFRLGSAEPVVGVDAYIESLGEFRRAVSDFAVDIPVEAFGDGDHVTTTWIYRGRLTGSIWGIPASGNSFEWRGCSVWTFDGDDRIVELRTFGDLGQLIAQLAPS